jgi:hypothetical protein
MGYNTTVIVLNDALTDIANDPEFGHKLARAISRLSIEPNVGVSAGYHAHAATAIETHHADGNAVVVVGGNSASVLGYTLGGTHYREEDKIRILRQLADDLGYSLRKKQKSN